jgi:hypothetical protein
LVRPGNENKNVDVDAGPRNTAIAPDDFARASDPIFIAGPPERRVLRNWAGSAGMLMMIVSGVIGLHRFSLQVTGRAQPADPTNLPDAGLIVRSELIHVWLPETLSGFATRQSRPKAFRTHDELRNYLERQDNEKLWYALKFRTHQVDGGVLDVTFIRWPYDDAIHFNELLDVLATAAGNPPEDADPDYSRATVQVIDPSSLNSDAREAIAELLRDPPLPGDREGSP